MPVGTRRFSSISKRGLNDVFMIDSLSSLIGPADAPRHIGGECFSLVTYCSSCRTGLRQFRRSGFSACGEMWGKEVGSRIFAVRPRPGGWAARPHRLNQAASGVNRKRLSTPFHPAASAMEFRLKRENDSATIHNLRLGAGGRVRRESVDPCGAIKCVARASVEKRRPLIYR